MLDLSLPTIAEILASTHLLSRPDARTKVVRVHERFAVKYGGRTTVLEADNLKYLSAHSTVPITKLYAVLKDPDRIYIVMEFIEGQTLEKALPSLNATAREDVLIQLQAVLSQLRSIPSPGYLGSVNRQPFNDGIFRADTTNPARCGPFTSQQDMNEAMLQTLAEECVPAYVRLLRQIVESTMQNHRTVFTHADLQAKNVMLRKADIKRDDGTQMFDVVLIDWEMSGWYPEYWEFCSATCMDGLKPKWLDMVREIMPAYLNEYMLLKTVRTYVLHLA